MTAQSEALYLPVVRPVRKLLPDLYTTRQHARDDDVVRQHPIPRLTRQTRQRFAYGPNGYSTIQKSTGHLVDIYA